MGMNAGIKKILDSNDKFNLVHMFTEKNSIVKITNSIVKFTI